MGKSKKDVIDEIVDEVMGAEEERYKARVTPKNFQTELKKFGAFLRAECPRLDSYTGFSEYLVKMIDDPAFEKGMERLGDLVYVKKNAYPTVFKTWQQAVAPKGLPLARGMHGLLVPDKKAALTYACLHGSGDRKDKPYSNYSMNCAYASSMFADPTVFSEKHHYEPAVKADSEESVSDAASRILSRGAAEFLRASGLSETSACLQRAMTALQSSMLLCGRAKAVNEAFSFGGDSESGDMNEAEVWAHGESWIKDIFVLSPQPLDAPLATEKERRDYCLSWWNAVVFKNESPGYVGETRHVYLHADVKPPKKTKRVVEVREPADHVFRNFGPAYYRDTWKTLGDPPKRDAKGLAKIAQTFRWYRVR